MFSHGLSYSWLRQVMFLPWSQPIPNICYRKAFSFICTHHLLFFIAPKLGSSLIPIFFSLRLMQIFKILTLFIIRNQLQDTLSIDLNETERMYLSELEGEMCVIFFIVEWNLMYFLKRFRVKVNEFRGKICKTL